jgi:hypothetical protein
MIIEFKIFEKLDDDEPTKYNVGDFILYSSEIVGDNKILRIDHIIEFSDSNLYDCSRPDGKGNYDYGPKVGVWENEIIRKLEDYEIDANKYNI